MSTCLLILLERWPCTRFWECTKPVGSLSGGAVSTLVLLLVTYSEDFLLNIIRLGVAVNNEMKASVTLLSVL